MYAHPLFFLVACPGFGQLTAGGSVDTVPDAPSYDEHVATILDRYCAGCHTDPPAGGAPDYFRLDQYAADGDLGGAFDMAARIDARAGGTNTTMPPSGNPAPTQVERDTLAAWVADGAPEFAADTGGGE